MAIEHKSPYWYKKDYVPPSGYKERKYKGKYKRPLTKDEKQNLEPSVFPWETKSVKR